MVYLINGTQIEVGPFSADYFVKAKRDTNDDEEYVNEYNFSLNLMISEAISKLVKVPVYAYLHSIDATNYSMIKEKYITFRIKIQCILKEIKKYFQFSWDKNGTKV